MAAPRTRAHARGALRAAATPGAARLRHWRAGRAARSQEPYRAPRVPDCGGGGARRVCLGLDSGAVANSLTREHAKAVAAVPGGLLQAAALGVLLADGRSAPSPGARGAGAAVVEQIRRVLMHSQGIFRPRRRGAVRAAATIMAAACVTIALLL